MDDGLSGPEGDELLCPVLSSNEVTRYSPEGIGTAFVLGLVQGVDLAQGSKAALKVVDDGPREERLGAVGGEARSPVNIVIDERLVFCRVCKV